MDCLQVLVGGTDPNPLVSGSGANTLQNAGIEVAFVGGAEEKACFEMNTEYMTRIASQAKSS